MSKKRVTLNGVSGTVYLNEGIKNPKEIAYFCKAGFLDAVNLIGLGRDELNKAKILSIKFVGLRKANENTQAKLFLSKEAYDGGEFGIWDANPFDVSEWNKEYKTFDQHATIWEFDKKWFERITGLKKQATLKIGDIYSFNRIEMRVERI